MGAEHELRTPNRNKRGERTRAELVEAAWRIVDRMSLVELLAGLTPNAVASEAGMTTGAFRHHFEDSDQLVRAMVEDHLERGDRLVRPELTADVAAGLRFQAATVRAAAVEVWGNETSAEEATHRRRRALLSQSPDTTFATGESLRDLMIESVWQPYLQTSMPLVDQALAAIDRTLIPPFRTEDVVRLLRAILDGLVNQSTMEPGTIDARFFADALTGVLVTLTAPSGRDQSLADLEAALTLAVGGTETVEVTQVQALAVSALSLFDHQVESLTFSQIAAAVGRSIDLLVRRYGTVRRMAAIAFVEVLPRVEESAARYLQADPTRALADTLCDIARMAQQHPHVAAALLYERSEQAVASSADRTAVGTSADIRCAVPLTRVVERVLNEVVGIAGLDLMALADDLVDLTLLFAGTRSSWAPAEVARRALSLLPV